MKVFYKIADEYNFNIVLKENKFLYFCDAEFNYYNLHFLDKFLRHHKINDKEIILKDRTQYSFIGILNVPFSAFQREEIKDLKILFEEQFPEILL